MARVVEDGDIHIKPLARRRVDIQLYCTFGNYKPLFTRSCSLGLQELKKRVRHLIPPAKVV